LVASKNNADASGLPSSLPSPDPKAGGMLSCGYAHFRV
jgi:hypothetical protein